MREEIVLITVQAKVSGAGKLTQMLPNFPSATLLSTWSVVNLICLRLKAAAQSIQNIGAFAFDSVAQHNPTVH